MEEWRMRTEKNFEHGLKNTLEEWRNGGRSEICHFTLCNFETLPNHLGGLEE